MSYLSLNLWLIEIVLRCREVLSHIHGVIWLLQLRMIHLIFLYRVQFELWLCIRCLDCKKCINTAIWRSGSYLALLKSIFKSSFTHRIHIFSWHLQRLHLQSTHFVHISSFWMFLKSTLCDNFCNISCFVECCVGILHLCCFLFSSR